MATPAARHMLKIPGKLIQDPTNLSAASPYGGTVLGLVRAIYFRPTSKSKAIEAEEWGSQVVEVIHGGTSCVMAAVLRGYDDDALSAMFLDTATGTPSRDTVARFRVDSGRAGTLLSTKSMKLLFEPGAPIRHRAIILREALPVVTDETEMALDQTEELGIPVMWYGVPDSSGRVAEVARIGDLSL